MAKPLKLGVFSSLPAPPPLPRGLGEAGFLAREVRDWETSRTRRRQLLGELYYRGEQQILRHKRTVIGPEGAPVEVTNLPNAHLTDNQYARLLDQKVNYLLGRPPVIVSADRDYAEALRGYAGARLFPRSARVAAHDALAGGCAWLFACPDGRGRPCGCGRFRPWEVQPFWADADHTELDGALRVWEREEHGEHGRTRAGYAELYTRDGGVPFPTGGTRASAEKAVSSAVRHSVSRRARVPLQTGTPFRCSP